MTKHKQGDVRFDGMVFYRYDKGREVWKSPSDFESFRIKKIQSDKKYRARRVLTAEQRQMKIARDCCYEQKRSRISSAARAREHYRKNCSLILSRLADLRGSDPVFRLSLNSRTRVSEAIAAAGFKKNSKTSQLLGCSWDQLRAHLESQFADGMNWSNYGKNGWHVDHIIPLASAKTLDDLVSLLHYTNLQPLWALDNLRKSDKLPSA